MSRRRSSVNVTRTPRRAGRWKRFSRCRARLGTGDGREIAVMMLRERLSKLARKANADADTPERSEARRGLRSVTAVASGRVQDRNT
jgi:hypothetical protein